MTRQRLADTLGCHPSLIESLEQEPLVFSALNVANILNLLKPLGLQLERPEPEHQEHPDGIITFGSASDIKQPYESATYEHIKTSHQKLREFVKNSDSTSDCFAGPWEDDWERLWTSERRTVGVPAAIFLNGQWQMDSQQTYSGLLFQDDVEQEMLKDIKTTPQIAAQGMSQSAGEWKRKWDEFRK